MRRRLNNLFAFSAIGTSSRFVRFQGPATVVLEGRVYHRLLDVAAKGPQYALVPMLFYLSIVIDKSWHTL